MTVSLSPKAAALAFLTPARQPQHSQQALSTGPYRTVTAPTGPIAVWESGDGPAVLLVHGWSGTHADLSAFTAPLLAAGRRVISMDLPAHGRSEGTIASIPDLANGIMQVIRAVGPITGVIAHSIGCAATGLALKHGMEASHAVLVAPPSRYTDFARAFARQAGVDPDALLAEIRNRDIDIDSIDYPAMAPGLKAKALVIHSRDDQIVRFSNGQEIAAAWPDARLIACDGLGHGRILADPAVVSAAVSFLTV